MKPQIRASIDSAALRHNLARDHISVNHRYAKLAK